MTWSEDQRSTHAHSPVPTGVENPAEHPAKSIMARRWEQRRAEASARWLSETSSVVLERSDATDVPSTQDVLEDLRELELKTAAPVQKAQGWLGNTQRAMLIVAIVSNSVLFTLLYVGGFLE